MKRLRPTPSLAISLLALFFALGGSALAVTTARKPIARCDNGSVKAYAAVNLQSFAGPFPQRFTSGSHVFASSWVCNGGAAEVRNAGAPGLFEIRFAGIASRTVVVSSLAPESGSASWTYGAGAYQVRVTRPDGNPSNYGFSIAVY